MLEHRSGGAHERELEQLRAENRQLQLDLQSAKSKQSLLKQKLNLAEERSVDLEAKLLRYERSGLMPVAAAA